MQWGVVAALFSVASTAAFGRSAPEPAEPPPLAPLEGPRKIDAGHDLTIDLPAGYLFLDAAQARKFMERLGNLRNEDLLGVLTQRDASWIITVRFTEDGYVKDDEAEQMDADAILNAIRQGTEDANKERATRGFRALHVLGWSEAPRYVRARHQLVWAIRGKAEDAPEEVINYNTRVLGRKGFASLNLIDAAQNIAAARPSAEALLAVTGYRQGARYEDFDSKTDKVAKYGLAALVVGGAGAAALKLLKVGLLAKFGTKLIALLIALKKAIVLLALGIAGFVKRLFRRKQAQPAAAPVAVAVAAPFVPAPAPAPEPETEPAPAASPSDDREGGSGNALN